MFIAAGRRYINTDNIVEIQVSPASKERYLTDEEAAEWDYPKDNYLPATVCTVDIVTTGIRRQDVLSEGFESSRVAEPCTIHLRGDIAEEFCGALVIYGPLGKERAGV